MNLFDALCAALSQPVTLWRPTRAANATAGRNDPSWATVATFPAIIEEHDAERRMSYGGALGARNASMYCADASAIRVKDLIVANGVVWEVQAAPCQPMAGGHWETFLGEQQHPPAGVS